MRAQRRVTVDEVRERQHALNLDDDDRTQLIGWLRVADPELVSRALDDLEAYRAERKAARDAD